MPRTSKKKFNRLTASDIFGALPSNTETYVHPPVTASLMNYVPSSVGGSLENRSEPESVSEEDDSLSQLRYANCVDERCEELWQGFRDAAGPWRSHRFTPSEWDTKPRASLKHQSEEREDSFNGILSKEYLAPNLDRVDMCPEFQHYAFTKCVLAKKKLTDIDLLKSYQYLQYVDVSSNRLTTLKALGNMPFLKVLDASHNVLTTILDFKAPFFLTMVNLSHNRIKTMRDLDDFWSITDLNLSHNLIRIVNGVRGLRYLNLLNLSYNKIETIENLGQLRVQFLFLQNNMIKLEEDDANAQLDTLKNIRKINLSFNQVSSLKAFERVVNLECLDVVNNNVSKLLDIYYLRNLKYLNELNLNGNPVTEVRRYIDVCATHIQNLVELDGERVRSPTWLEKLSNATTDVSQVASQSRLKLLVLEQFNPPQIWNWLLPYNCPPIAVIVLVGTTASNRAYIARRFCTDNSRVVVGIPYTTRSKHKDEINGDYFYYINEETFMTMLKNGEFLTYQEIFGSYYGIAHSEFKKADGKIIMFYTNLTMALSIRRNILNTILVLSLPSTKQAHLSNLKKTFAVQFIDKDTLKIIKSPVVAAEYRARFAKEKHKLLVDEVQSVVEELVTVACAPFEEKGLKTKKTVITDRLATPGEISSRGCPVVEKKSDIFQLWWARSPTNALSLVIQPTTSSDTVGSNKFFAESNLHALSKSASESAHNTTQFKRYVSFTFDQPHSLSDFGKPPDSESAVSTSGNEWRNSKQVGDVDNKEKSKKEINLEHHQEAKASFYSEVDEILSSTVPSKGLLRDHECYTDMMMSDSRVKSLFDDVLRQRDELLELHLEMPGLFRELLFTDNEQETFGKLKTLVNDIMKYYETTTKAIINIESDKNIQRLARDKINTCFKELKKEVSLSEKQAEEYTARIKSSKRMCEDDYCDAPSCPEW